MVGIVRTESNFRNDVTSKAGAKGLSQVMPATAKAKKCGDLNDPYENVLCGARVLKAFIDYYKGDLLLGLSGYNAGHGMPGKAKRTSELPANTGYIEKVLWARARYLSMNVHVSNRISRPDDVTKRQSGWLREILGPEGCPRTCFKTVTKRQNAKKNERSGAIAY